MEEKLYRILKKHKLPLKKREEMMVDLFDLFSVSERYLHINDAAALIKSMPTDQAIQKMKAALSGQPETTVIDGELLISYYNAR